MWILKQHQNLSNPDADNQRIVRSWDPSQVIYIYIYLYKIIYLYIYLYIIYILFNNIIY